MNQVYVLQIFDAFNTYPINGIFGFALNVRDGT
jgi:hypothetical protein